MVCTRDFWPQCTGKVYKVSCDQRPEYTLRRWVFGLFAEFRGTCTCRCLATSNKKLKSEKNPGFSMPVWMSLFSFHNHSQMVLISRVFMRAIFSILTILTEMFNQHCWWKCVGRHYWTILHMTKLFCLIKVPKWKGGGMDLYPAFRRGPVCRGQFGEVLSFLRPTVQTIIECPRLPGTITVEWFLLCAPALR